MSWGCGWWMWSGPVQRWHADGLAEAALHTTRPRPRLDLSELELEELPTPLLSRPAPSLTKLFLHNNRLQLPLRLPAWPSLATLTLDYNELTRLPDLSPLVALRYLNVSHNPLTELPASLGRLSHLEVLWCNCTRLTRLPDEICQLSSLQVLGARTNKISRLPDRIVDLSDLCWVTLQDNILEELPEGLSALELVHLNVSFNCLREFPKDLAKYRHLQYLKADNNQINCLPFPDSTDWDLSEMESIVYIDIQENPIIDDPVYKETFQKYPQFKISKDPPVISNIPNIQTATEENPENNQEEPPIQEDPEDGDSDSSYDDWEQSVCCHHLNCKEQVEDELEDHEFKGVNIMIISKFAGTGS